MSRPARPDPLPASLPPRGLGREVAARYIGVSPGKFDQMVADGLMPAARRAGGRKIWDRIEIDSAFDALPHDEEGDRPELNEWDEVFDGDAQNAVRS